MPVPNDPVPPRSWLRDPNQYAGSRIVSGGLNQGPRYSIVKEADGTIITRTMTPEASHWLTRLSTDADRNHGVTTSRAPIDPQIQVPVLTRASRLFSKTVFQGDYISLAPDNKPNMYQRLNPELPEAFAVGVHSATAEPVFMGDQRSGHHPDANDDRSERHMGDNLHSMEFFLASGQPAGNRVILYSQLAVPGNFRALKTAIKEKSLNSLIGEAYGSQQTLNMALERARYTLGRGQYPNPIAKRLAASRHRTQILPNEAPLDIHPLRPDDPPGQQTPVLNTSLPVMRNFMNNGYDTPQLYVHQVPLLANMQFSPIVYGFIDSVARTFSRDVINKPLALQATVIWRDLVLEQQFRSDAYRSEPMADTSHRVRPVSLVEMILGYQHYYRWHEALGLLSFVHPFIFIQMIMKSDAAFNKDFAVDSADFSDGEVLRVLTGTNFILAGQDPSVRVDILPHQVLGSLLPEVADAPRLSMHTHALIGVSSVFITGIGTYSASETSICQAAYPLFVREEFFYSGPVLGVPVPHPASYFDASDLSEPVAVYRHRSRGLTRWYLQIRDWTAEWPAANPFTRRAGPFIQIPLGAVLHQQFHEAFRLQLQACLDHLFRIGVLIRPCYVGPDFMPYTLDGPPLDHQDFITANHYLAIQRDVRLQTVPEAPGIALGQYPRFGNLVSQQDVNGLADRSDPQQGPEPVDLGHKATDDELTAVVASLELLSTTHHASWKQLRDDMKEIKSTPAGADRRLYGNLMKRIADAATRVTLDRIHLKQVMEMLCSSPEKAVTYRDPKRPIGEQEIDMTIHDWHKSVISTCLRMMGFKPPRDIMSTRGVRICLDQLGEELDANWEEGTHEFLADINEVISQIPAVHLKPLQEPPLVAHELSFITRCKLGNIGGHLNTVLSITEAYQAPIPAQDSLSAFMQLGETDGSEAAIEVLAGLEAADRKLLGLNPILVD